MPTASPALWPRRTSRTLLGVVAVCLGGLITANSTGCGSATNPAEVRSEVAAVPAGHARMRQALREIAARSNVENDFVGDGHALQLRSLLADEQYVAGLQPQKRWELFYEAGRAELRLGNEKQALGLLKQALDVVPQNNAYDRKRTHFELGLASLRFGETQNCCQLNTSDSCIVPIRGQGLHQRPAGSRQAIEHFTAVLERPAAEGESDEVLYYDATARWLLNIAYMTLGEYPQSVPEAYRVDPEFFQSSVEFPRFKNVYPELGLDTFNLCGGAVVDDFDNDGDLDIITCTWDVTGQMQVFRNNGDGSFDEVTEESSLKGFYGGLNLVHADYDNDGDLDIYVMRGAWLRSKGMHPNSLLRNDGDLRFTDVTFEAGLGQMDCPTKTAAWADYDLDGDLDLYVGNESSEAVQAPCQLFRNEGDGTFTSVAQAAGIADVHFSMGAAWGDFDGDRYPDLYLSVDGPNKLYHNNRDGTFTDVAEELGVDLPLASFPTWFWDYNNDGHLDIFVGCTSGPVGVLASDIRFEMMHLYQNRGDGTFQDVAEEAGLHYPASPMGANFGDLNQDGYPEFYLATGNTQFSEIQPNVMFLNQAGQSFANVTMAGGFGHLQKGHGVSFADLDNDGDQDVYVQLGGAYPGDRFNDALFINPGFAGNSVTIQAVGEQSNRCAIGTRLELVIEADGQERSIFHTIGSGGSFGGNPLRQAIGVGSAEVVKSLRVQWPASGQLQEFTNVPVDRAYRIVEGAAAPEPLQLQPFAVPRQDTAAPKP